MKIELKTQTVELKVSTEIAEKVDPVELAELITASGMMEAANAAGVDPVAALDAMLNTPDVIDALLSGAGIDAISEFAAGIEEFGLGFGLPQAGPDFGGSGGFGGDGSLYDGGVEGHVGNSTGRPYPQEENASGNSSGGSNVINFDDIPQNPERSNGQPYTDDNGKVTGVWVDGKIKIDVEPRYDAEGNLVGYVDWNGEYKAKEDVEKNGWDAKGPEDGKDPNEGEKPEDGNTKPGDAGKPDDGKKPAESDGEGNKPKDDAGGDTTEGDDNETVGDAPKDDVPGDTDNAAATGSGTDGTTQPGSGDDEGGMPDNFDFGDLDDLDETTQPGLLGEDGSGIVVTVNGPGYGLTQPVYGDTYGGGTINPDMLDPTYGTTQPGLTDADLFIF